MRFLNPFRKRKKNKRQLKIQLPEQLIPGPTRIYSADPVERALEGLMHYREVKMFTSYSKEDKDLINNIVDAYKRSMYEKIDKSICIQVDEQKQIITIKTKPIR